MGKNPLVLKFCLHRRYVYEAEALNRPHELQTRVIDAKISDHQQSWGYEDGPWKEPGPSLLVAADLIHKPPASIGFAPINYALAVTVKPFKFSPAEPVAYELSYCKSTQKREKGDIL